MRESHELHKYRDIRKLLPDIDISTIFDVGANIGNTVSEARHFFPDAEIYAFEPVKATFAELESSVDGGPGIHLFNAAMGSEDGEGQITADGTKPQNRLVDDGSGRNTETVQILSGDAFCDEHKVDRISFLKIDAEGHDLEVLRGFRRMIGDHAVDLIQVEAGMTHRNRLHVPLERFKGLLEPLGYFLFRIYEQKGWRKVGGPELGFANPIFISEEQIQAHMKPAVTTT
jgi:FkbM family methyltransferase